MQWPGVHDLLHFTLVNPGRGGGGGLGNGEGPTAKNRICDCSLMDCKVSREH